VCKAPLLPRLAERFPDLEHLPLRLSVRLNDG
jgi:hypothetical protein